MIPGISRQKAKTSNRNNIATNSIKIFKVVHIVKKKKNRGDVGNSIKKKKNCVSLMCQAWAKCFTDLILLTLTTL